MKILIADGFLLLQSTCSDKPDWNIDARQGRPAAELVATISQTPTRSS